MPSRLREPKTYPLALRKLQKEQDPKSAFVFVNERGTPFDREGFNWLVERTGKKAGLFQVRAHMLRHAAGYTLANAGKDTRSIQAYLGHKDIRHRVRYTELSPTRFKNFWPARLTSAVQKMIRINPHQRPFLAALSVSSRAIAPGFSFRVRRCARPSFPSLVFSRNGTAIPRGS